VGEHTPKCRSDISPCQLLGILLLPPSQRGPLGTLRKGGGLFSRKKLHGFTKLRGASLFVLFAKYN
jgi:hypothetical protein